MNMTKRRMERIIRIFVEISVISVKIVKSNHRAHIFRLTK